MKKEIISWLKQLWQNIKEAQNDKEYLVEAQFPYHNGESKVYFAKEDMIEKEKEKEKTDI